MRWMPAARRRSAATMFYGSYLNALMLFPQITGVDPRTLGFADQAAADLGIDPTTAVALQTVAYFTDQAGGRWRPCRNPPPRR